MRAAALLLPLLGALPMGPAAADTLYRNGIIHIDNGERRSW